MTLPFWLDDNSASKSGKQEERFDVVIIGGGMVGAGCAYELANVPGCKVAIVENGVLASGSSGRNAGMVLRGIQTYYNQAVKQYGRAAARSVYQFAEENQALLCNFVHKHGNSFDYEPCGSYLLACSLEELDALAESAELMNEDGFELQYLKEDPIDRDFYGALMNPNDAAINPVKFVRALVECSQATVFENEPVCRIESNGSVLSVHTSKRIFKCDKVLLVTNAYTPLLHPWFIDKILPARGQILVTQPLRKRIVDRICYADYGFEYFRQLPDLRLLLGGRRQLYVSEEVGYAEMITKNVQSALEGYLKDRFPDVAGVPIDYRFSGVIAFTKDGLPLVGELKQNPGVFYAVGFNGHGLGYGLRMSKLLVDMAMASGSADIFDANRSSLSAKQTVAAAQTKGP